MRIALVICSVGRSEIVATLLPFIQAQSVAPSDIMFVVTKKEDLPDISCLPGAQVILSEKGLSRQRNHALNALLATTDAIFFIDDDYLPSKDTIAGIARALESWPDAVGFTGKLLADGIHSGGVSVDDAKAMLVRSPATSSPQALNRNLVGLYGCNMVYRTTAIGKERFDERLPLYGWQEDVDFAARISGEKMKTDAFCGVHCGTTRGRETSGHLLGYSQVANPIYLMRKGSVPVRFALKLMLRNILSNHAKIFWPEPWVDRRERARGNRIALWDVIRRRDDPEQILNMVQT